MSITILKALTEADRLLHGKEIFFRHQHGRRLLHNAVFLLQKGHGLNELVEPLLEQYSLGGEEDAQAIGIPSKSN